MLLNGSLYIKGACSRQCSYRCSSHRHLGSEGRLLICIQLSIKVRAAFTKPADCCRSRRHESGRKQQPNLRAELRLVLLRHMYAIIGIVRAFGTCHLRKSHILLMSIGSQHRPPAGTYFERPLEYGEHDPLIHTRFTEQHCFENGMSKSWSKSICARFV